jgi:hypothetical protein
LFHIIGASEAFLFVRYWLAKRNSGCVAGDIAAIHLQLESIKLNAINHQGASRAAFKNLRLAVGVINCPLR